MREEEVETAIKVVVVGNGAVGKSSMIQRYCKGIFTKDYKKTIGVDFLERQIEVNGEDVRLMLWDTAGQEEFDAITKAYYRGAQACVVAFSTVDRDSYDAVEKWKSKVEEECGDIAMVLVQNKIDLQEEALVTTEEADMLSRKLNLRFYKTSVKDNLNVDEVFRFLAERYLAQINNTENGSPTPQQKIGDSKNTDVGEKEEPLAVKDPRSTSLGVNSRGRKSLACSLGLSATKICTSSDLFTSNVSSKKDGRHDKKDSNTIQLHPNKRRTHGKKSAFQKCSVL